MSTLKKLIEKARTSPENITYSELCLLFEHYGFEPRVGKGSHKVYKRKIEPKATYPVQEGKDGKAKSYQVTWLTDWVAKHLPNGNKNEN